MITKIQGEAPFQVLTNNFSISPSKEGYTLQISADGENYSNLFSVGANVTRLVTGVAANSYYRLLGNQSDVSINWMKTCVTEGGGGGTTYTAGEYINIDQDIISVTGITPDLYLTTADTQDFATEADITAATSPIEERIDDVERVTASALTELHNDVLEISGATPTNSPIIPAITTQAEYEAISGDVKTGDLIQVYNVDINGDNEPESGLFGAYVQEEEDQGVITRTIGWERRDNINSVLWSTEYYPWMDQERILPIDIGPNSFLIAPDGLAEDEAYNGIGFDDEGKAVITHIVPQYDEQTGDITGITREDRDILGELDEVAADVSEAFSAITETQQVAAAGLNVLESQISTLSGNTYTKAQVDAEITGATENMVTTGDIQNFVTSGDVATQISAATSDMKTYVDNRIDGYTSANTITIGTTSDSLSFIIAAQGWMGPEYDFYLTNTEYEVATLDNAEIRAEGTTVYAKGAKSGAIYYGFDNSAVLTSGMLGQKFSMSTAGTGAIEMNETNFPTTYPQYFILDKTNMEGWFTNELTLDVLVPGVVKSDGVITQVKKLTQAEYDAIVTPDASTLYIIVNN